MKQDYRAIARKNAAGFLAAGALAAFSTPTSTQAGDPASITAESRNFPVTGTVLQSVTVSSKNVPDLVDSFITNGDGFNALANEAFISADLKMLGVDRVISFDVLDSTPATGTPLPGVPATVSATLTSSVDKDLNVNFTGPTREDVKQQIRDWLKKNGADELAKILRGLDAQSKLAVNNGNPNSTTALLAHDTFQEYGFTESKTASEIQGGEGKSGFGAALVGDAGFISAQGLKAQSYSLPIGFSLVQKDRWALTLKLPLNWTQIEGADIYRAGIDIGVPILIIGPTRDHPAPKADPFWRWQLTPSGGAEGSASMDLISGGLVAHGSMSSSLEYNFGERWHHFSLTLGNQISVFESVGLTIGDYHFDPGVSAQIVKNGLRGSLPLGDHFVTDLYFIDTRFFGEQTAMGGYETLGISLGYRRAAKGAFWKVGTYANIAGDYSSVNVQFGTGWNF